MEQSAVVIRENVLDRCDPHGYYLNTERQQILLQSPTKRSFLKECIRQIYILQHRGDEFLDSPRPTRFNRTRIWRTLNLLMRPARLSTFEQSVERVKRKLFRDSKPKSNRKQRKPRKACNQQREVLYFRAFRYSFGVRNIRRNYLREARQIVLQELGTHRENNAAEYALHKELRVSPDPISEPCKYHKNSAKKCTHRQLPPLEALQHDGRRKAACQNSRRATKFEEFQRDRQHRERQRINEKLLEEAVRSIYYIKSLLGLMIDLEHNLYIPGAHI